MKNKALWARIVFFFGVSMTPSPLSSQAKSRALRYNGDGNTYYNRWKLQHLKGVDIVLQPSIAATFKPYFGTFSSVCQAMEKKY